MHESCGRREEQENAYVCHLCVAGGRDSYSYKMLPPTPHELTKESGKSNNPEEDEVQFPTACREEEDDDDEDDRKMPAVEERTRSSPRRQCTKTTNMKRKKERKKASRKQVAEHTDVPPPHSESNDEEDDAEDAKLASLRKSSSSPERRTSSTKGGSGGESFLASSPSANTRQRSKQNQQLASKPAARRRVSKHTDVPPPHSDSNDEDDDAEDAKLASLRKSSSSPERRTSSTEGGSGGERSFLASSPSANTRQRSKQNQQQASSAGTSIRRSPRRAPAVNKDKKKGGGVTTTAGKRKSVAKNASSNKRLRTTSQQKAFLLSSDKKKPDPLLLKRVAFDIYDNGDGTSLMNHFGGREAILPSLSKGRYLFGTISELTKRKGKGNSVSYDVQWDDSVRLRTTSIELSCLIPAIDFATELKVKAKEAASLARLSPAGMPTPSKGNHVSKIFGKKMLSLLLHVDEGEEGEPELSDLDSVSSLEDYELEDNNGAPASENDNFHLEEMRKFSAPPFLEDDGASSAGDQNEHGFRWSSEGSLLPPATISQRGRSSVKPDRIGCFETPLSSFFAFVPLKMFRGIAMYSNAYAYDVMTKKGKPEISGGRWVSDITISEIMKFFGILLHMVMRPTPGSSYPHCWSDPGWHPYTSHMTLRRFQQIRSVLHFNYNLAPGVTVNDSLYKVRPLLNCMKMTFPSYLQFGDNFALDEASVASRSRYGNDVIFFNPTKPGGKYHFRFYLLCCSSSYACIRLRMHTRNNTDFGDGYFEKEDQATHPIPNSAAKAASSKKGNKNDGPSDDDDDCSSDESSALAPRNIQASLVVAEEGKVEGNEKTPVVQKKIVSLVLDMCKPLYETGSIVNMDNYYTSPEVAVALRNKGVFMRGTCRANRLGFPSAARFTNREAANQGRGAIKRMVDIRNGIAAYGWVDGNPVHFITSADGTATSTVSRRIGRQIKKVRAPVAIRRYNNNMHAVDRHDQLRDTYSLSKRHGFKKYYHKIVMGLLDMVVVNAWVHYRLVHKEDCKKPSARYEFMSSLADAFLKTDWNTYNSTESAKDNEKLFRSLFYGEVGGAAAPGEEATSVDDDDVAGMMECEAEWSSSYCHPVSVTDFLGLRPSKKKGLACQVCAFEGRGNQKTRNVVICMRHRLRLCTGTHKQEDGEDEGAGCSWRAPEGSCWKKAHSYYIPNGLFIDNVTPMTTLELELGMQPGKLLKFQCVRTGCNVYKKKHESRGTIPRNQIRDGGKKNYSRRTPTLNTNSAKASRKKRKSTARNKRNGNEAGTTTNNLSAGDDASEATVSSEHSFRTPRNSAASECDTTDVEELTGVTQEAWL